ncbi:MAG: alpha-glucan family phosphorylase [Clostridiaceae bacterium]
MSVLPKVAYFSMEYGLNSDFKTYAGGLGILAGDYIKGAKEFNYPIVSIGILWKQGYTDQRIDKNGNPFDCYHNYIYDFLEDTGVTVNVNIREKDILCKVWKVTKFDNADLYLLDTDLPENKSDNFITGQLYGWFGEERIAQEIVLGIGGVRALRKLGIDVDVYHFNEGHALFAGFELLKEKMDNGNSYEEAFNLTREEIVFTTHTPIVEGNESHPIDKLMYLKANNGIPKDTLIDLGGDPFNMTVAALKLSRKSNAVAKLHGETANKMWSSVDSRSEIVAITNAIHMKTWVDDNMIQAALNDKNIYENHMKNKKELIDFIYNRNGVKLKEDSIIIGFSRRAAPYKRSNFIFTDEKIMRPLLESSKVQIVFSGKAHPLDDTGKDIVANIVKLSKEYPNSVVFLENYDMNIGKALTRGADVWLNNPRRPKEASGTSGMKAAMNGVLNMSILDGWWPEACNDGVNGWQIGNGFESDDEDLLDENDLKDLYRVLLDEVLPTYYDNKTKWTNMMTESILSTKDYFSVERMLKEYYKELYIK